MAYLHACIFAKYVDLSGVVDVWQTKCPSLCIVEHPAEGKTKRIHCHFLMEVEAQEDWFRSSLKKTMGDYAKRGNYWIASRVQKGPHAGESIDRTKTLIYILKGKLRASFAKNFSEQEMEEARQAWVESYENDKPRLSPTQQLIKEVESGFDYIKCYNDLPTETKMLEVTHCTDNNSDLRIAMLFAEVRSQVCRVSLREVNQMPHPSQYKIVASTVFINIMKRIKCENRGLRFILERWY